MRTWQVSVLVLLGALGTTQAAVVVPNVCSASVGNFGINTPTRNLARTYQCVIDASQFAGLSVGDQITGLHWRAMSDPSANTTATWPASTASWANFDIYISTATTTPGTISNTFAANEGADKTAVRLGAYSVAAGAYVSSGVTATVSPWGPLITFTTPFTYSGGGITVTLRHTGNDTGTAYNVDGVAATNTAMGYGTAFAARAASAASPYTATTGTSSPFVVTQFEASPAPTPSSLAILGLGGLAISRRRRS
jgi:hypothetical protein